MLKNHLRIYLLIFLSGLFISACAQIGLQSKKETSEPASIPECKKNYTKEGIWPFNRVYKTWVKYDPLDTKKGFDAAAMAIKARGDRVIFTDRDSGTINTEMTVKSKDQKTHPVEIKLVKEKTSLTVHLSSKSASGTSGQECFCSFYEEFEKSLKRSQPVSPKQTLIPPKKPVEAEKTSPAPTPSPTPSPVEASKPSPAPTPPPKALPQTQVIWASVNVREGPGTNYKVIRRVKKGTSLSIIEEKNGWLRVRLQDGKEAWISKTATSEAPKTSPSPSRPPSPPPPPTTTDSSKPKSPM